MEVGKSMTAHEIIRNEYQSNPQRSLLAIGKRPAGHYDTGECIGAWSKELGRFVLVVSKSITGEWVSMPIELLINGEPPVIEYTPVSVEVSQ